MLQYVYLTYLLPDGTEQVFRASPVHNFFVALIPVDPRSPITMPPPFNLTRMDFVQVGSGLGLALASGSGLG